MVYLVVMVPWSSNAHACSRAGRVEGGRH